MCTTKMVPATTSIEFRKHLELTSNQCLKPMMDTDDEYRLKSKIRKINTDIRNCAEIEIEKKFQFQALKRKELTHNRSRAAYYRRDWKLNICILSNSWSNDPPWWYVGTETVLAVCCSNAIETNIFSKMQSKFYRI